MAQLRGGEQEGKETSPKGSHLQLQSRVALETLCFPE